MANFIDRLRLSIIAFKEQFLSSPVTDTDDWNDQDARRLRYEVLWKAYEGTAYRDINTWATAYRKQYALYKYIRPVYNPAFRLGQFWQSHLFGGLLDPEAGEEGAIPIATENEMLRPAIADLWKWSRWSVQKDILTARGAILGDVAIQVIDDVDRKRVYLRLMHPGIIQEIDRDPFGNVKGYVLRESRVRPDGGAGTATYSERVTRAGDDVVYETFLDGAPYAWPENVNRTGTPMAAWSEPYTFVPLVVIQHNDVGLEWGWSELHPIRAKVQEADDIASMISDSVRKTIDPLWLMKGMKRPGSSLAITGATDTADTDRPAPGREEIQAIWNVPVDGGAEAMVPDLDLENVLLHLNGILEEIEKDMKELSPDLHTASGDASGRALRVARQPVVSKVIQRRANYDAGLLAAQQMALAIGGFRGYNGYEGFDLESFAKGDLEHNIAERPVFEEDPLDKTEVSSAFWTAAGIAKRAGVPTEAYLKDAGWSEERIAKLGIVEPREVVPDEEINNG